MVNVELIESSILIMMIAMARMSAAFILLPFLSAATMGGNVIKNGVSFSLAIFLFPIVQIEYELGDWTMLDIVFIVIKEIALGIMIGYSLAIFFWSVEAVGFFIDNQRGATMASSLNPLSGSQTSPLGILLAQAINTLFFTSGAFLIFMGALYASYHVWPVFSFWPTFGPGFIELFLNLLDLLMYFVILLGAPVVIAMFLAEYGLALIGRFAPQMDVFFLAMPVKSAVAIAILILYLSTMIMFFSDKLHHIEGVFVNLYNTL